MLRLRLCSFDLEIDVRVARSVLIVLALGVLASCATPLTVDGGSVLQLSSGAQASSMDCVFLGVLEGIEGSGLDIGDDQRGALNQVRNRAADMGANAFVVSMSTSTGWRTTVQAEAYHCPTIEGTAPTGRGTAALL